MLEFIYEIKDPILVIVGLLILAAFFDWIRR
jgi:hypothetical protein